MIRIKLKIYNDVFDYIGGLIQAKAAEFLLKSLLK